MRWQRRSDGQNYSRINGVILPVARPKAVAFKWFWGTIGMATQKRTTVYYPTREPSRSGESTVFKIGDKVKLISGSPDMTVIGLSPNGRVWVQWVNPYGSIAEASLVPQSLAKLS